MGNLSINLIKRIFNSITSTTVEILTFLGGVPKCPQIEKEKPLKFQRFVGTAKGSRTPDSSVRG